MLDVTMTPNLLGFRVAGDARELEALYDDIWSLAGSEEDHVGDPDVAAMRERLLALCYDLRHAVHGDRGFEVTKDEFPSRWDEEGLPTSVDRATLSFEVLYPEAMYEVMAIGYLVRLRTHELSNGPGGNSLRGWADIAVWDSAACHARYYQSLVLKAVGQVATKGRYARIREHVTDAPPAIPAMYEQWLDILNEDHAMRSRKGRAENLSVAVRDMAQFHRSEQYWELKDKVDDFARERGTHRANVRVTDYDWLDEAEW